MLVPSSKSKLVLFVFALAIVLVSIRPFSSEADNVTTGSAIGSLEGTANGKPHLLYESCKTSLADGAFSEESSCKVAVMSVLAGASFLLGDVILPTRAPDDPYQRGAYDAVKKLQKRLCVEDVRPEDIAKNYINFYEKALSTDGMREYALMQAEFSMAASIFMTYSCNEVKGLKNGVDHTGE